MKIRIIDSNKFSYTDLKLIHSTIQTAKALAKNESPDFERTEAYNEKARQMLDFLLTKGKSVCPACVEIATKPKLIYWTIKDADVTLPSDTELYHIATKLPDNHTIRYIKGTTIGLERFGNSVRVYSLDKSLRLKSVGLFTWGLT